MLPPEGCTGCQAALATLQRFLKSSTKGVKLSTRTPVTRPVRNAISQWTRLETFAMLPGIHAMHALVGCQKR